MRRTIIEIALITLLSPFVGAAPGTQPSKDAADKQRFVIFYTSGPHGLAGKPIGEQPLQAHGDYMHSLFTRGTLFTAGPLTDSSGGLAIIDVADDKQARAVIDAGPAVHAGVFKVAAHPWYAVDWQNYGK